VARGDPELGQRIRRLWAFGKRLVPERYTSGITRFRSLEDFNRDREERSNARAARLRAERLRPK
jgi:hypothetical protein